MDNQQPMPQPANPELPPIDTPSPQSAPNNNSKKKYLLIGMFVLSIPVIIAILPIVLGARQNYYRMVYEESVSTSSANPFNSFGSTSRSSSSVSSSGNIDSVRYADIEKIRSAVSTYIIANAGNVPQYEDNGFFSELPTVTTANITTMGVACELMTPLIPDHLTSIPTDPIYGSSSYICGKTANGAFIVGTYLSNGNLYSKIL